MNSFNAMQRAIEFEIARQVGGRRGGCTIEWGAACTATQEATWPALTHERAAVPAATQVELLQAGRAGDIVQETRLWDEGRQCTYSMRKKEGLADYRYFPEPDLPPVVLTQEWIDGVQVRRAGGQQPATLAPHAAAGHARCPLCPPPPTHHPAPCAGVDAGAAGGRAGAVPGPGPVAVRCAGAG